MGYSTVYRAYVRIANGCSTHDACLRVCVHYCCHVCVVIVWHMCVVYLCTRVFVRVGWLRVLLIIVVHY